MNNNVKRIKAALEAAGHVNVQVIWDGREWTFCSGKSQVWHPLGANVDAALREIKINHQINQIKRGKKVSA